MAETDVDFELTPDAFPGGVRYLLVYHRGAARVEQEITATAARDIVTTAPAGLPAKVQSAMGSKWWQIPQADRATWAGLAEVKIAAARVLFAP